MLETEEKEKQAPDLALDDLLGISRVNRLAFLKSYYDESISHAKAKPPRFLVLGGCTMSSDSWDIFSRKWSAVLEDVGISTYRSSDCNSSNGEYVGWDGPKKDALRERLIEVINQSWRGRCAPICPVFIWSILNIGTFNDISTNYPQIQISPYEYSVLTIVAGSACSIENLPGEHTLGLFFEDGQDVRPHIRQMLRKKVEPGTRITDISFLSKGDHIPLQVSDMIAYEAWKSQSEGKRKVLVDLLDNGVGQDVNIDENTIRNAFISWSTIPS